jgi:hypothetical protein
MTTPILTEPTPVQQCRVDALLAVAEDWSGMTIGFMRPIIRGLLPHLDTVTAESYMSEASLVVEHAECIRTGHGAWRDLMPVYLAEEDRTNREDAAELDAAEASARAVARDVLLRAVEADDALADAGQAGRGVAA